MNFLGYLIIGVLIGVVLMRWRDDAEMRQITEDRDQYQRINIILQGINHDLREAVNRLTGATDAD